MDHKDQDRRLHAAALKRLERLQIGQCFDPIDKESRPTPSQTEILDDFTKFHHRYVRAGNQTGKTQIGAREAAWVFEENHPKWSRPAGWAQEPLILIVIGRVTKQVEEVLWRKIKGFLDPGLYTEVRSGGALQKVVHKVNGNTIIFASHHSDNEAREKVQAYVAHYVWIDEMPGSANMIEELHRRVQARNGYFLATFTPKVKNEAIKKFIDSQKEPLAKTYRLKMLDNPIYEGREQMLLDSMAGLPEAYRNCLLYGDWLTDENTVYQFDSDTMVVGQLPPNYSPAWRHCEGVDPALKSKFGFVLLAENPDTGMWYVVKAQYFSGIFVPREMVIEVQKHTAGYNIVKRCSDPHETWYIHTAADMHVRPGYMEIYDKSNRKGELMKNLQTALGTKLLIPSWCIELIDEFQEMRWSESQADTIVNGRAYHLIDALQYALDILPKYEGAATPIPWQDKLYEDNEKRKKIAALATNPKISKFQKIKIMKSLRSRWTR